MSCNIALVFVVAMTSHLCLGNPIPNPDPTFCGNHHRHIRIHVPHDITTLHHHHVQSYPVYQPVPVVHEVPVIKHVPIIKPVAVPVETTHYGYGGHGYGFGHGLH